MEPRLTDEDRRIWHQWVRAARRWATTRLHRSRVERTRRIVEEFHTNHPDAYVAWSAGKDSTAMTHLIADVVGPVRAMSIKDDLDFPGEEDYLRRHAEAWGVRLDIVRPPSLQAWLRDHADEIGAADDVHSRAAGLSRVGFYPLIEEYDRSTGTRAKYLGLRAEESHGRKMHRAKRGAIYTKTNGEVVCQPICDWRGIDVYAYLLSRNIDLLPLYRCVRLHDAPERVRKSWWVPGAHAQFGQGTWLRTYYPGLFQLLEDLLPGASAHA